MLDDSMLGAFWLFVFLAAAIPAGIIGIMLFRFSFHEIWCVVAAECLVLLLPAMGSIRNPTSGYDGVYLIVAHVWFFIPVLIAVFAGYFCAELVNSRRSR